MEEKDREEKKGIIFLVTIIFLVIIIFLVLKAALLSGVAHSTPDKDTQGGSQMGHIDRQAK